MKRWLAILLCVCGLAIAAADTPTFAEAAPEAAAADTPAEGVVDPFFKRVWNLKGVMHPLAVHLPVGVIIVAAGIVLLRLKFKKLSLEVAYYCMLIGAVGLVGACVTGWAFADLKYANVGIFEMEEDTPTDTLFYHRWGAVVITIIAVVFAVFAFKAQTLKQEKFDKVWQAGAVFMAAAISLVGHWGGYLMHGDVIEHHVAEVFSPTPRAPEPPKGSIDKEHPFIAEVAPIFVAKCIECHGEGTAKGKLRMHTKADFFKGGSSSQKDATYPMVKPGDITPEDSAMLWTFYTDDEEELMPPPDNKKKIEPLTKDEIKIIEQWVKDGADWPDGYVLSK